ncbi:FG-GAP and VCBS repeat-containing protein [Streptomyces sp. KMM 9044]|uniref:FG-GAP and VCBS repeat-containing protein n=1 Tax=Streptomyces sp. KMM 9044 TaxID=2744474 RepID=UPI002150EE52|nr:FG-GAP and VCBS repeat-containing protein [Streptomyces sp. KMM 9044]WAX81651.1 FG-GAP and VCBS repeat-containing protein [Streptomyces sp. KMM 9044]
MSRADVPSSGSVASGVTSVSPVDLDAAGCPDVAIAAPGGIVNGRAEAGYVAVVYGMARGPNGVKRQLISQNRYGIPGTAEAGDRFGSHLAAADLDDDDFTDLVVGALGEDADGARDTGRYTVLWGSMGGLATATATAIGRGTSPSRAGDFDGDGHPDLATAQHVRYGPFSRTGGAARTGGPLVSPGIRVDVMEAGDVDGDGMTDLVVSGGRPARDGLPVAPTRRRADAPTRLQLLRGTESGPMAGALIAPTETVSADSIALGDVDGDGPQDVVFGRNAAGGGGLLGVVRGTGDGPGARATLIGQDSPGVPGTGESGDRFGTDVAVGDVTGDGYADVVTGVPGEDLAGREDAGRFVVLRESATGSTGGSVQVFGQNTAGVPGSAEDGDRFGQGTAVVGGHVVVSAPGENGGSGAMWAFTGTTAGITATGSVSFGPGTLTAPTAGARLRARYLTDSGPMG